MEYYVCRNSITSEKTLEVASSQLQEWEVVIDHEFHDAVEFCCFSGLIEDLLTFVLKSYNGGLKACGGT